MFKASSLIINELVKHGFVTSFSIRKIKCAILFFSSPEPKAPGELIGWEGSVVRLSVRPSSVHNFKRLLL